MKYAAKHAAPSTGPSTAVKNVSRTATGTAAIFAGLVLAPSANASPTSSSTTSHVSPSSARNVWDRVAACESGGRWNISTGNGYYGGLQFSYRTWLAFGGGKYARTANRATRSQQITIAKKVLRGQGPGAWGGCARRAGLTRSNGAAASAGKVTSSKKKSTKKSTKKSAKKSSKKKYSSSSARRGKLVVDGVRGPKTNRAIERWIGAKQDGKLTTRDRKLIEKKLKRVKNGRLSRADVRKLQRRVGATPDGVWGPLTTKAVQRYLNKVLFS